VTRTVYKGEAGEREELVGTLTLAFVSDPLMRWVFPTPTEYLNYFSEFVGVYGGTASTPTTPTTQREKRGWRSGHPPARGSTKVSFWGSGQKSCRPRNNERRGQLSRVPKRGFPANLTGT